MTLEFHVKSSQNALTAYFKTTVASPCYSTLYCLCFTFKLLTNWSFCTQTFEEGPNSLLRHLLYLLLYLMSLCSCVDVLGEVGVCHLCSVMWGYASMSTVSSRSSPSFTSTESPWWASLGDSCGNSRM